MVLQQLHTLFRDAAKGTRKHTTTEVTVCTYVHSHSGRLAFGQAVDFHTAIPA